MSAEDEVRAVSQKFYAALNRMANGDAGAFADVWSHGASVTTMHPIGGREVGWDAVRRSIKLNDQYIQVAGDMAYELGIERGQVTMAGQSVSFDDRVTNIYRRESGAWKIVHHHTDLSQGAVELLTRLKAKM